MKKYKLGWIIISIAIIILVLPPILTTPALFQLFNFSHSGEIGDTIGGITAPFINGLAAILVYVAFKEQIKANERLEKANKRFERLEEKKIILDELSEIKNDMDWYRSSLTALKISFGIEQWRHINNELIEYPNFKTTQLLINSFNNITFQLKKMNPPDLFLSYKILSTYRALFMDDFLNISSFIEEFLSHTEDSEHLYKVVVFKNDIDIIHNEILKLMNH